MQYRHSRLINKIAIIIIIAISLSPIKSMALNETDIQNTVNNIKNNKQIVLIGNNNNEQTIIIKNQFFRYLIDIRTESCFVGGIKGHNFKQFSCKKLKKGYPLYAPLITWE